MGRSSARSCAPGAPSADVTDLVQPRGAPGAGHARGNAQLRGCPPTCKTQTPKPGQTSQWTWIFLLMDILEGRVCSSSSAPGGSRVGHRSHPSITARRSSPQFMLHNTWLMREHQSLECWPFPCQFWHFSHQSTRNKSHLLPCWFTGVTKPPCAGGSRPRWHSQGTVKSSAGSKTAQSQEDRAHQSLGSGSSCQHLFKHQPSSTSPTKPLVVVHPLTELVSSGLKPGNY